jgi:hypothetical protein
LTIHQPCARRGCEAEDEDEAMAFNLQSVESVSPVSDSLDLRVNDPSTQSPALPNLEQRLLPGHVQTILRSSMPVDGSSVAGIIRSTHPSTTLGPRLTVFVSFVPQSKAISHSH